MSLRLTTPQTPTAQLRILAAGKGPIAIKAREEISKRTHAELLRLVRCN